MILLPKPSESVRKKSRLPIQRLLALFLLAVFIFSLGAAPASVYAVPPRNTERKMEGNYPGPLDSDVDQSTAHTAVSTPKTQGERLQQAAPQGPAKTGEITENRTAYTTQTRNADGTVTEKLYLTPINYQKNGRWEKINTTLIEDKNAGDSGNIFGRAWGNVKSWFGSTTTYTVKENDWQARFAPSDDDAGMVRVKQGDDQMGFVPIDAKSVAPVITTDDRGAQTVHYYDLWPGVDVSYAVTGGQVKESIVFKDKNAVSQVTFKVIGANLSSNGSGGFAIKGVFSDKFVITSVNLMRNKFGPVTDTSVFGQTYKEGLLTLYADKEYLQQLPGEAFPVVLDPGIDTTTGMPGSGDYRAIRNDGNVCHYTSNPQCKVYVGGLDNGGGDWKYWRSAYYAPYSSFQNPNKRLVVAKLYMNMQTGPGYHGTTADRWVDAWRANCNNAFSCVDTNLWAGAVHIGSSGDVDVTNLYKQAISVGDFNMWLMLTGEEGDGYESFKEFDPAYTYMSFTWGDAPPAPAILSPLENGQVFPDPQVSFKVQGTDNPNNQVPLQYELQVGTGADGSGMLVSSGLISATRWTIPDGILQDGSTYYVRARSYDSTGAGYGNWGSATSFKIDMRNGKDNTQTYDTLGPVGVNLATGNVAISASTHTSAALGGSLGLSLDYNSPVKSRPGLNAEYWNNSSMTGSPFMARVDENIDFDWGVGSPSASMNADNFSARWTGYFVAPNSGNYYFGANNDDSFTVKVNNQTIYTSSGCPATVCYGAGTVALTAGQIVPIEVTFSELTGNAYAKLWAKGAVSEGPVPTTWLQTEPRPISQAKGLTGRYYTDDGNHDFNSNANTMFMQRTDPWLNFDWGTGAPVTSATADNFMVRWTGYFTPPATGNYNFGANTDDGVRITINNTQVLNEWQNQNRAERWGSSNLFLTQGVPVPVTLDYYEYTGSAAMTFKVRGVVDEQVMPADWLTPKAQVLPDGWNVGLDPDGSLNYDRAKINQNSVVLTDSTGSTHEYTWKDGGYKPPVNEDGQLVRNADGTLTLQDADGRTYVFNASGELISATSPIDDRKPAALKYEYAGTPAKIQYIRDGVDSNRWARVYYGGDAECAAGPSGFDAAASTGMLCALKTNDGRTTNFFYHNQRLARIAEPGDALTDFAYDSLGRITAVRDVTANDAVAAGVRTNDASVLTEITYDVLGRATSVKQPAAATGANRIEHSLEYLPGSGSYFGATKQHVVGATEPHGFSRRIEYDSLFRTTKVTDIANLSTVQEWHANKDLLFSTVDATGLKSTTIYDDDDRPIENYGPAPSLWYGTVRKPLTAYAGQIPRTDTKYDEGITGAQVAWYNVKDTNGKGSFVGAPKLHTTGILPSDSTWTGRNFTVDAPPITPDAGMDGYGFSATGKLRFPQAGTYTLRVWHDDGARVWVDDRLIIDDWNYRSEGTTANSPSGTFVAEAGKVYRFRFDYMHVGNPGLTELWFNGPGIPPGDPNGTSHPAFLSPGYNVTTSVKTYDSTIGDTTTTTNYGANPELGLPQSTAVDPTGLNLVSGATYEPQGATNSFLRQTSKTLPGGTVTNYGYYNPTETRDNPCTTGTTETFKQAGFIKTKTEPDPDGAGAQAGRVSETIYDDAGRAVASRYNSDDWTCTAYDSRGRVTQTVIPAFNGAPARTVTNNYAVGGNPLITSVTDAAGTITTTVDLLGRTVSYTDVHNQTTTTTYDMLGRLTGRSGPLGAETFVYDNYHRLTEQKLDGTTYATVTYDAYSRVQDVTYNQAEGQAPQLGPVPTVQSVASGSVSSGSLTLNKPSGTANGDLLVMTASADLSASEDVTYTIPSGWTQLLANTRSDASGAGNNLQVWYKVANNEPANYAITPDHNNLIGGSIMRITGQDAMQPIDVSNVTASATGEASAPSVTTTVNNTLALRLVTWDQSKTVNTIPSGHTQSYHVDISGHDNWGGYKAQTTAGSTGTAQFDLSSGAPYVGFTVAIKPTNSTVNNQLKLEQIKRDNLQRASGAVFRFSDGTAFDETVTRTQSGRVASYTDALGSTSVTNTYSYDKAGRLLEAVIDKNKYTYGYGAPSGSTCNQTGANLNAHKNSNRTSYTLTNIVTSQVVASSTYCYDQADRFLASSDTQLGTPTYDSHGNIVTLAGSGAPITFTYDASDRNVKIEQGNTKVEYVRTATGEITRKKEYQSGTLTVSYRYLAGGAVLQTCSLTNDNDCATADKYLGLPGGVSFTLSPGNPDPAKRTVYSIKNFHGDTAITANEDGAPTGSVYLYEPFGQASASATFGTNSNPANATDQSMAWASSPTRKIAGQFTIPIIQMGARIYLPTLGRFAQVDPIEGGTPNNYTYPPDPVNMSDYSGLLSVVMSGSNLTITGVLYNYGMQPHAVTPRPIAPAIQATRSAARTQGPGSARSNTGRTSGPSTIPKRVSALGRVGEAVSDGAGRVGNVAAGMWNSTRNAFEHNRPHIQSGIVGCGVGITGSAVYAYAAAGGGQFYLSAGAVASGCLIGGTSAVVKSVAPETGGGVDAANQFKDAFDIYWLFFRR